MEPAVKAWLREQLEEAEFLAWTFAAQQDWAHFARWAAVHTALLWALGGESLSVDGQQERSPFAAIAETARQKLKQGDEADAANSEETP